jgi:hypothetical protein
VIRTRIILILFQLQICCSHLKLTGFCRAFKCKLIWKIRIVFWDVLPCKIIADKRFRGTCCFHHQGSSLIPDDGGSTYLWNVGRQLFDTALHPRRQFWTSYSPPWELEISHNLKDVLLFYIASNCTAQLSRDVKEHIKVARKLKKVQSKCMAISEVCRGPVNVTSWYLIMLPGTSRLNLL